MRCMICCNGISLDAYLTNMDIRSQELEYSVVLEPFCNYKILDFGINNFKERSLVVVDMSKVEDQ